MRFTLDKKAPNQIEFGVIYGVIALIILGVAGWPPILSLAPGCVFKTLTGIPCPTCGSTRSLVHLSHGDIVPAFFMNPLVTLAMVTTVLYFLISLITLAFDLPRIRCMLTDKEKSIVKAAAVTLLLAQWSYLMKTL
jgi:hypothetical protein